MTREYLVECEPRQSDGTVVSLRWSRWGYTTLRGDTPADTPFEARLLDPGSLSMSLWADSTTGGQSEVSWGEVVLNNRDGGLDYLLADDYGWAGCPLRVLTGERGAAYSTFVVLFDGLMEQAEFSLDEMRIFVRGPEWRLFQAPLQPVKFAGTNVLPAGLEGTASDIKGRNKPFLLGQVFNVSAPCVNTSRLTYQVSSGEISTVDMVYDQGLALVDGGTTTSSDIDPGGDGDALQFGFNYGDVSTSNDTLALTPRTPDDLFGSIVDGDSCVLKALYSNSALPAPLAVSTTYYVRVVDVPTRKVSLYPTSGDAIADTNKINLTTRGGYAYNGIDIVPAAPGADPGVTSGEYVTVPEEGGSFFRLGQSPAGLITADVTEGATAADRTVAQVLSRLATQAGVGSINATDVTDLDTACAYPVGIYVDDDRSALDAMDEVARSIGAYYYFSPASGELRMGQLTDPAAETAVLALGEHDVLDLERVRSNDTGRGVPAWRVTVRYAKNYTVQTSDIAGAVTDARRAFLAAEYREEVAADASVQTVNPDAPELSFDTLLIDQADAAAEATRLLGLYSARRDTLRVTVPMSDAVAALELGDFVSLTHPRFGLSSTRVMVLTGIDTDWAADRVTLTLWG